MTPAPVPLQIRQPSSYRIYILAFALVWCGFVAAATLAVRGPEIAIPLVMLGLGAPLFVRLYSLAVVADEAGIVVRNYFRTRRIPWGEVEDFRIGPYAFNMPLANVVQVVLRRGTVIALDVTMGGWWPYGRRRRARLDEQLAALRAWLPR